MTHKLPTRVLIPAAALLALAAPSFADVPVPAPALELTISPYFDPGYLVGLAATWEPVAGAELYRVTHFRQDDCGSATVALTTAGLSSGSGLHRNCGAPESCYFKQATVEALDGEGTVLASAQDSFCEVGYLEEPPPEGLSLDDLPANVSNTRFFPDLFVGMRPALTLRGFDCDDPGLAGGCDHGLGMKQVLERVYASTPEPLVRDTYVKILELAVATPLREDRDQRPELRRRPPRGRRARGLRRRMPPEARGARRSGRAPRPQLSRPPPRARSFPP